MKILYNFVSANETRHAFSDASAVTIQSQRSGRSRNIIIMQECSTKRKPNAPALCIQYAARPCTWNAMQKSSWIHYGLVVATKHKQHVWLIPT